MNRPPQFLAALAVFVVAVLAVLTAPEVRAHHVLTQSSFQSWCAADNNYVYVEIRNVNNRFSGGLSTGRQRGCQIPNTYQTKNYEYCLSEPFPADYGDAYIYHYDKDRKFIGTLVTQDPDTVTLLLDPEDIPLCEEVVPDDKGGNRVADEFTESNRADANRPGPVTYAALIPGGIQIGGLTPPVTGTWTDYRVIRHHDDDPDPVRSNVVSTIVAVTTRLDIVLLDNGANVPLVEGRTYWYRIAAVGPTATVLSRYDDSLSVTYSKLGSAVHYAHVPASGEGGELTAPVSSGRAVLHGATVTFTAAPATGWTLAAWEGDVGDCVAPDLTCAVTANTDLRVTAHFARIIVSVEYEAIPPDGGSLTAPVSSGGTTFQGATVTWTAAPAAGWTLAAWEGDVGDCVAPDLTCAVTANTDLRVTAHFDRIVAVVEYAADPANGGTLTASVPFGETALLGATVTFTAAPAAGWYVEDWEGGGTEDCSGLKCAVTVVSGAALLVTARFAEAAVVLVETASKPPHGGALSAELPGTGFAFLGSTVTFTAAPAAEWYVTGWNRPDCADTGAAAAPGVEKKCALTADADLLVTVNFAVARAVVYDQAEIAARRTAADGGAAVANGETVADGVTIVFLATPPENHEIARWTNNNAKVCPGQNPCRLAADADLSVRADFASLLRTIVYTHFPVNGGTLTASVPSGGTTLRGATVTFTAAPAAGWYAKEWTGEGGGCAGSRGTCALTVAAGLFVTVHFAADCPGAQIVEDGACACAAGLVFADNDATCLPPADAALVEEVYRSPPVLATIRALLDGNANPNLTLANGAPLVFAAATLRHDKVMSVLITAGANPYATYTLFRASSTINLPNNILHLAPSGFLSRIVHWGGAATIWAGSPTLDWSPAKGRSEIAYESLANEYHDAKKRGLLNKAGGYLLDLGADCPDYIENDVNFKPLCTSRHVCATSRDNKIYDCLACPGAPALDGNECVSTMKKCEDAGWGHSAADDSCQVPLIAGDGSEHAGCHLSGVAQPQCAAVFGAGLDFPSPTLAADGATLRFVYNCDPDGDTGLVPATQNTNGATECACAAAGEEFFDGACVAACTETEVRVGGVCVAAAVTVAAQSCAGAGRDVFAEDGGGCAAAITLSGGTLYSGCYFSGGLSPQCATVFGADFAFPAASAEGPFVYNCDPEDKNGLIPAGANTISATECSCPDGEEVVGDVCMAVCAETEARVGGVCVAAAVTVAAQSCADAGRDVFAEDGGGCAAAITLSGGTLYSGCYFSGGRSPQCATVFGADFAFPAASAEGPFVYNCDPEDKNGLIPATSNTVEATECGCPAGMRERGGVCVAEDRCFLEDIADTFDAAHHALISLQIDNCDAKGWGATRNSLYAPSEQSNAVKTCHCDIKASKAGDAGAGGCGTGDAVPETYCQFSELSGGNTSCSYYFGDALEHLPRRTEENKDLCFVAADCAGGRIPAGYNAQGERECACPDGEEVVGDVCMAVCAPAETRVGGVCVASAVTVAAQSCADAGRDVLAEDGGGCAAAITLSGGTLYSRCYFSGGLSPQCATVFGANFDFPDASAEGPFVYNCDPEDKNGLIPATSNTVDATECACAAGGQNLVDGVCACPAGQGVPVGGGDCGVCPSGETPIGGVCLPDVVKVQCGAAGWVFSEDDGGSCGILLTLAGGAAFDRCYMSGANAEPQCEAVFGSAAHYFPAPVTTSVGATLRFVYNCDPDGDRGGRIPARANTIAATECGCESNASHLRPGACVPDEEESPDFGGIAQEALCEAFGGTVRIATGGAGGSGVCSGMDANDTFCILDAEEVDGVRAFPCRGLFKHLRSCNLEFNRPALNPFFCGERCPGENQALGSGCDNLGP